MTAVDQPATQVAPITSVPGHYRPKGLVLLKLITTTDLADRNDVSPPALRSSPGCLMALLMRGELAHPGMQFLSTEQFNQLFTMHGTVMPAAVRHPIVIGRQLRAAAADRLTRRRVPRLNAMGFWLFLFGALVALAGFLTPGGAADFGWTAYAAHRRCTRPASAPTCGSWVWASVVWAPSSVRST